MLYTRALDTCKIGVFRDICLRTDIPNYIGRVYPRAVVESAVEKVQERVANRTLYGSLMPDGYPDGWTVTTASSLGHLSHVVTDLHLDENGDLIAVVDILNTKDGIVVSSLLEAKAAGLFTRGIGSIEKDEETGNMIVQPDFEIQSVDICLLEKKTWPQPELRCQPETLALNASTD